MCAVFSIGTVKWQKHMKGRIMRKSLCEKSVQAGIEYPLQAPCSQQPLKKNRLRSFHNDETGSIVVFSLYIIILMVIVGSLGIFLMRTEYRRTTVQYTLDRAILAAASLKQEIPAAEVVRDYFDKAGLEGIATNVQVDQDDNYRRVSVDTSVTTDPHMIGMFMDVPSITSPIAATAVDGVEKVEISLVLDVSGSMGDHSRLPRLKVAAKEFVDTLLTDPPEPDTYSISIVPYSTQVNAGANILAGYNVTNEHSYSNCIDFGANDFKTAAISTANPLQRTGHFAPWTWSRDNDGTYWGNRVCVPKTAREILPLSGNRTALKNYIDNFVASGWTSTDVGIKWGAALLDPSARPVVSNLISLGGVESKFAGRPSSYTEEGVLKVIVVMTDGANTNQYFLNPFVATGLSPVWHKSASNGKNKYWVYNDDRNGSKKYRRLFYRRDHSYFKDPKWVSAPASTATQMTYAQLWNHATMRFVSTRLFDPASLSVSSWDDDNWNGFFSRISTSTKDVRMNDICSAAKANNVLMYTIGFEITDSNAEKLQHCATTASHFFRVEGVEISEAFAAIAAQLHSLRLVR